MVELFQQIEKINDALRDFLKLSISYLCSRCDRSSLPDVELSTNSLDPPEYWHNDGKVNTYLKATSVPFNIDDFFDDVEHGAFHGLMTAFLMYHPKEYSEQIFCSSLLHDFIKATFDEGKYYAHDMDLKAYFPDLIRNTYDHASANNTNNLTICDRMELRRFKDHMEWVDNRFTDIKFPNELNLFFDNIRPALEYFYRYRKDIWIRHGFEAYVVPLHYPYGYQRLNDVNAYAIEHDQFPFIDCATHDQVLLCGQIKGFIPLSQFDGEIINSKQRDHLYAKSDIPIEDWTFTYHIEEFPYLKVDLPYKVNTKASQSIVRTLVDKGVRIVRQDNVYLFGDLLKKLYERIKILNAG